VIPSVKRPSFDGAPAEIANRKPLPYCGHSELGSPVAVPRCFLAAVLAGRPAEAVDTRYGTEGGTSFQIVRFTGAGPIAVYEQGLDANGHNTGWNRYLGRMVLGVEPEFWSMSPIDSSSAVR